MAQVRPELFKVGELIRRSGSSRQQIRDFLTMGLIKEQAVTDGGQHLFSEQTVRRLRLIRRVLRSGRKEYTMAELARTFKRLLAALLLAAGLLGAGAAAAPAAAVGPGAPERASPSAADRAAIRKLFKELCDLMKKGDAGTAPGLLASGLPPARVRQVSEKLEAEFTSRTYERFDCDYEPDKDLEVLGPGRLRVLVTIRWQYYERAEPAAPHDNEPAGLAYGFELAKEGSEWRIADDGGFFDTLSSSQSDIFARIFLWTAVGLVGLSFWGWMLLDCCFRQWGGRRGPWVLAMLGALLVGIAAIIAERATGGRWLLAFSPAPAAAALVYFFAVWMRQGPDD